LATATVDIGVAGAPTPTAAPTTAGNIHNIYIQLEVLCIALRVHDVAHSVHSVSSSQCDAQCKLNTLCCAVRCARKLCKSLLSHSNAGHRGSWVLAISTCVL
jgi:hypothetical protein